MWTIAAVNKKIDGPLGSYNGLTDVHLAHFFSRPNQQSHLKAAKLITDDGTIIPEQKFKIAALEYEKKRKMYDILANTVIQNAAHKEGSWNKKLSNCLEDILKMENVEKIKSGPKRKNHNAFCGSSKSFSMPPTFQSHDLGKWLGDKNEKSILPTPQSAPTTNRKSFKNHPSNLHSSTSKLKRCFSAKEASPYVLPLLMSNTYSFNAQKSFEQTIKPRRKKKKKWEKNSINVEPKHPSSADTSSTKITKLSFPDQNFNIDQCKVTLYYHGHSPLAKSQMGIIEEITIRQQHCGGTPVIIYKGQISPKESLTFICLDHNGFTFSITIFLDGIRYLKLSSCCIFRYSPGRRLGGSSGCFSIKSIEGGKQCLRCQYNQVESGSNLNQKFDFVKLEDNQSLEREKFVTDAVNFNELSFEEVVENDILRMDNEQENHTGDDDFASSVSSEIIHSASEEIDESPDIVYDNQDVLFGNDTTEQSNDIEDKNASVEENIDDESSYDSESSVISIAESVKNVVKTEEYQAKPYQSESSDDTDGVQEHIVIASVHGSPTRIA